MAHKPLPGAVLVESPRSVTTTEEDLPDEDVYLPTSSFVKWPSLDAMPPPPINFAHLLPDLDDLTGRAPTSPVNSHDSLANSPKSNEEEEAQVLQELDRFLGESSQWADTLLEKAPPAASEEMDHLEGNAVSDLAFADTFVEEDLQGLTGTQAFFFQKDVPKLRKHVRFLAVAGGKGCRRHCKRMG